MTIIHAGSRITVTGGAETWDSVYAYHQSNGLSIITKTGRSTYILSGEVVVAGNAAAATLNILSVFILITGSGYIRAFPSTFLSVVNFGELATINGKEIARNGCQLSIESSEQLSYSRDGGDRPAQNRELNVYDTSIFYYGAGSRTNIYVSNLIGAKIIAAGNLGGGLFVYTRPGARIEKTFCEKITVIEFDGVPLPIKDLTLQECGSNLLNWDTGQRIDLRGFSAIAPTGRDLVTFGGGFRVIDSEFNLANIEILNSSFPSQKAWSANIKIAGNLAGVKIAYFNSLNVGQIGTSNASGIVSELLLGVEDTSGQGNPIGSENILSRNPFKRVIRKYGYKERDETLTVNSPLGTPTQPFEFTPQIDTSIALSEAAATAVTGVTINHATQTITVANPVIEEAYAYLNAIAALDANLDKPIGISSDATTFTSPYAWIVNGVALTSTTGKKLTLTNGKTISTTNGGSIAMPVQDAAGLRYAITGLPANTGANPVLRVKRISTGVVTNPTVTSGSASILIEPGAAYEIRGDAIGYIASKFITINSNTSSGLTLTLDQIVDSSGNPVYGQGVQAQKDLITFDAATLTVTIAYSATTPQITAFSVLDKIEEILATPTGLSLTAQPLWTDGAIRFPLDSNSGATNPIKIQAAATNTGIPELLFEVTLDGFDRPYGLFDFSNGKVLHYPTEVNRAVGLDVVIADLRKTRQQIAVRR